MDLEIVIVEKICETIDTLSNSKEKDIHHLIKIFKCTLSFDESKGNFPNNEIIKSKINDIKIFKRQISNYFKNYSEQQFDMDLVLVKSDINEFFAMFIDYGFDSITESIATKIINSKECWMPDILMSKKFTIKFSDIIKKRFISSNDLIQHISNKYDSSTSLKYHLPKFSDNDIEIMIDNYLNSDSVSLHVLEQLKYHKNGTYKISKKMRKRIDEKLNEIRNTIVEKNLNQGISFEFRVIMQRGSGFPSYHNNNICVHEDWLLCKESKIKKLKKIAQLTGFMNNDISFAMKESYHEGLSAFFEPYYKDKYISNNKDYMFNILNTIFLFVYNNLSLRSINLENLLKHFIQNVINKVNENFFIDVRNLSKNNESYYCKCINLCVFIDSILKIYNSFAQEKGKSKITEIISDDPIKYESIASIIDNKYVYLDSKSKDICYTLFSPNSKLLFGNNLSDKYDSFYEALLCEEIFYSFFKEVNKAIIDALISEQLLFVDTEGKLKISNHDSLAVLHILFTSNCSLLTNSLKIYPPVIQDLEKRNFIKFSKGLFSKEEADYLNFILNNSRFSDSLGLRNKYLHGSNVLLSDADHKANYIILLRLTFQVLAKIYFDMKS